MADERVLDAVRSAMRASPPRAPGPRDRVYKDECAFSFDTPLSPGGLFVNLGSWQAFGAEYVELDRQRSGCRLYLHEQWTRVCSCITDFDMQLWSFATSAGSELLVILACTISLDFDCLCCRRCL